MDYHYLIMYVAFHLIICDVNDKIGNNINDIETQKKAPTKG